MKRIIALLFVAVSLTLCLSGCVYEELGVKLNKDGTGSISTTVGMKKDVLEQLIEMGSTNPFAGKETTETEYDGEKYITFTETKEYESFEEMEKVLSELTFDSNDYTIPAGTQPEYEETNDTAEPSDNVGIDSEAVSQPVISEKPKPFFKSVKIKKDGSKYVFDAVTNAVDGEIEGFDMSDVLKVNIAVEMPAKISAYKNGKVDGKKISFDLSDISKETELYAECKVSSPVPAIIGIVLAVGAVVAFIILKKRK